MLAALFNPGLRDRHWEKMSEIAGQDLRPNEVHIIKHYNWTPINYTTIECQPVTICGDELRIIP